MILRRVAVMTFVCCALSSAMVARAQGEPSRAERLFDEAKTLMQAEDYAPACVKLEDSERLDPQLGTLLHLAHCYEKRGQIARAYSTFTAAAELAAQKNASGIAEPREQTARERAASLAPQLATLELRPAAPLAELQITLDGELIERARWHAVLIEPGEHTILASAPAREDWQHVFTIGAPAQLGIDVPALALRPAARVVSAASPPTGAPPLAAASVRTRSSGADVQRIAGYVAVGVGVVGLGIGTVFGLMRNAEISKLDDYCDLDVGSCTVTTGDAATPRRIQSLHARAETYATGANLGLILGGLAVAGGLVLVFTSADDEKPGVTLGIAPGALTLTARAGGI